MMELNLIEFPEQYLDKGYINLIYEEHPDGHKVQRFSFPSEDEEEQLSKKGITITTSPYMLTRKEEVALKQIDLMKAEMVSIYRYKQNSGKDRFDLAPDKANVMHDDKAYVAALLGYQLAQMRRENVLNKKKQNKNSNLAYDLPIKKGIIQKAIG